MSTVEQLERFTSRADYYARSRPGYPDDVIRILEAGAGWRPSSIIADIGAGTGISSELFLRHGNEVWAVEPNADMRAAADPMRTRFTRFHLSDGTAECTRLLDASIDMVVAATAFHWFDAEQTRREFRRILKPGGYALLLWNERRSDSSPFLRAYEDLSQRFGTDYKKRGSERKNLVHQLDAFFGGPFQTRRLENPRQLDFNGVRERLLSASYSPLPGEPNHDEMMGVLREIFDHHQQAGHITFEYETVMYWAPIA